MRDPLRRFLVGAILSMYGDWLTTVALVVLLVRVTGSSAAPAGYMLARVIPRIVGAGPGGALADRFGAARVAAAAATIQGLLTAAVIPAEHAGSAAAVYAAVVLAQVVAGVSRAATGAVVPFVAPPSRVGHANALYNIGVASATMIAPAIGSPLLALRGPDLLLAADVGTFAIAACLMLTLPVGVTAPTASVLRGARSGAEIAWRDPVVRALGSAYLGEAIVVTLAGSVLVLAAHDRFGGAANVGYLYAAVGIGDALGGFLTLRRPPPRSARSAVVGLALVAILGIAAFLLAFHLWVAILTLAINGIAETAYISWGSTVMQQRVDRSVLGRVNGALVLVTSVGMAIGALLALGLVPTIGWPRALFVGCCLGVAVLGLATFLGPGEATIAYPGARTAPPGVGGVVG